jgi:streptogramin lyase
LYILNNGFAGDTSVGSFRNLDCAGAVRVSNGRAELGDFKLASSSTSATVTATICFKRGERWFVERAGVVSCELK